jgi:hypothetical protein
MISNYLSDDIVKGLHLYLEQQQYQINEVHDISGHQVHQVVNHVT